MVDIKNRWAFITGASRGIGKLTATMFAKKGCNLVIQSRNVSHTEAFVKELESYGVKVYSVEAELSDINSVKQMLGKIDSFGVNIEIVLNNAGYQIGYRTDYLNTPIEDFGISFEINTIAPMMICYHFLPKMIENKFGRIVNTTSGIALEPEQAGYSASKAALDKVTIDLGSKLNGSNVTINLTDPGWCRTDLGGDKAPNSPESALPGTIVGAFIDDCKSGRLFPASAFHGLSLEDAVIKAEKEFDSPYAK